MFVLFIRKEKILNSQFDVITCIVKSEIFSWWISE
jgi:hypothetical protein